MAITKAVGKYFSLVTDDKEEAADLYIFGDICADAWKWFESDVSAVDIVHALQNLTVKAICVHINSNGGDVSQGLAIYNTLKNSGMEVTTIDDGFACSAASVIFMAGTKRQMNSASLLMIHNVWTYGAGNSEDFRKLADDLDTINQASVEAYKAVATIPEDKIKELMNNETWISPKEAVEYGFATEILNAETEEEKLKQSARLLIMQKFIKAEEPKACEPAQTLEDRMAKLEAKLDLLIEQTVKIPAEPSDNKEPEEKPTKKKKSPKSGFETLFE
jgi:ATP-dependent Clp protease protease subunit|nr:MAG TPA: Putative ATP dependent Clp protease [Caudoviricetes sp.]